MILCSDFVVGMIQDIGNAFQGAKKGPADKMKKKEDGKLSLIFRGTNL